MTKIALNLAKDTSDWSVVQGRKCGDCTICCRIMPVQDPQLSKAHGIRCKNQTHHGCKIYEWRPATCKHWYCGWLVGVGVDGMSRPDRAGYVVDPIADFVTITSPQLNDGNPFDQAAVVIWVDPKTPEKWRQDENLFEFFERWGKQGFVTLVRYSSLLCATVFPTSLTGQPVHISEPKRAELKETHPESKYARAQEALK